MKAWIWLRIAAVLQALGTVGHNLATLSTMPTHGPREQAVFDAMHEFRFDMMGSMRSTWDFYRGYQFSTTVNFLLLFALLWMLSNLSRSAPKQARPFVVAILVAQLAGVLLSWTFFFAGPGVLGSLIVLCLAMAMVGLHRAGEDPSLARQQAPIALMTE